MTRNEDNESSTSRKRARARWAILRSALLKQSTSVSHPNENDRHLPPSSNVNTVDENNVSIHRFQGFCLIHRSEIPWVSLNNLNRSLNNSNNDIASIDYDSDSFQCIQYEIPKLSLPLLSTANTQKSLLQSPLKIRTIERNLKKCQKVTLKELASHLHFGVDNTGNTRVWDCSSTLAYLIFSGEDTYSNSHPKRTSSTLMKETKSDHDLDTIIAKYIPQICKYQPYNNIENDNHDYANGVPNNPLAQTSSPPIGLSSIFSLSSLSPSNQSDSSRQYSNCTLNVIELGSGMAALPSLFLSSLQHFIHNYKRNNHPSCADMNENKINDSTHIKIFDNIPNIKVTITDGHPNCIQNNKLCTNLLDDIYTTTNNSDDRDLQPIPITHENNQCQNSSIDVHCQQLLWKTCSGGVKECQQLVEQRCGYNTNYHDDGTTSTTPSRTQFDLCLVSDCIHFVDFHDALIATIGRLLRVGGLCLLCQPCRGDTLRKFVERVEFVNSNGLERYGWVTLFDIQIYHKYDKKIMDAHEYYSGNHKDVYDFHIHYPVLLCLRKMRQYDETVDTHAAINNYIVKNDTNIVRA
jgi:hypothetical protein